MGGVGGWKGKGGFSFILVVVCSAPRKTLTRVLVEWGMGGEGDLFIYFGGSVQCAS